MGLKASSLALLAALVPCALAQSAPVERQAGKLALHEPVERDVGTGQTDVFTVDAAAGQFLHVVVEQIGVYAALALADPDGKPLVTMDSPSGAFGPRAASTIANRDGAYQVRVAPVGQSSQTGRYRVELTDLRVPTEQDRTRLRAEATFLAAVAQGRAQEKTKRLQAIAGLAGAAALWHSLRDDGEEGTCLHLIGFIYASVGETRKALDYFNRALPLRRAARDRAGEAATLIGIGFADSRLGDNRAAMAGFQRALPLEHAVGDRASEAGALQEIGVAYSKLGDNQRALDFFHQALELERALGDRARESATLLKIGIVYSDLGEKQKALDSFGQALSLEQAIGDRVGEAGTLAEIGVVYSELGEKEKALDYYNRALPLEHGVDPSDEAETLAEIGVLYAELGDNRKAMEYFNQALPVERAVGNLSGEAGTLAEIGMVYSDQGQKAKALDYFHQALRLERAAPDPEGEEETLHEIGVLYAEQGKNLTALTYYNQALRLERTLGDRSGEAVTLSNLGLIYSAIGQKQRALRNHIQALQLARAVSEPAVQGGVLSDLMSYYQADQNPGLAVFFGKQAVSQYQEIRRGIQGLDTKVQRSYLRTVTLTYRRLADLLIAQHRFAEAEQVLGLLKEQEYFSYVRRDTAEASAMNSGPDLNPDEADCDKRYREISGKLVAIGVESGELRAKARKTDLTPEEMAHLDGLEKDIATANMEFEKFLRDLQRLSAKPAALTIDQLRETQGIMTALKELPPGTVAIYTLAGEDKFRAILRTPEVQKAYEYPIKAADLDRKVLDFRQVAQDPRLDPRPMAEELYNILIRPMAEDLRQANAQTLMWSLDGGLRYLPLAALYDGQRYLIERYRLSVITLASDTRLLSRPDAQWKAAGFGVTLAHEGAAALPEVSSELAGIIATKPGDGGVLSGEIKLDGDFTRQAMRQALLKGYQVVHIASHFSFQPGNETTSFLLLGDGGHLSLADLRKSANLFEDVQLLTLSACNTGVGDGTEVEGFGALAQRQGAKAVIASLWPVADESTSRLMQEFYRIRESSPGMTKLEALRESQLELLRGGGKAGSPENLHRGAAAADTEPGSPAPQAPPFPYDPKTPFAHPYYWAPFFLMGNWL